MNPKSMRIVVLIPATAMCLAGTSCVSFRRDNSAEPGHAPPVVRNDGSAAGVTSSNEALRRHAAENYAVRCMDRADSELKYHKFDNAAILFRDAIKNLAHHPDEDPMYRRATIGLGETYYRWARALEKAKDYEGAVKMARRAAVHGHDRAAELYRRLERRR